MELTERALRDLLMSPYAENCAGSILDAIENGEVYTITMDDDSTLVLTDRVKAESVLEHQFGWK